MRSCNHGYSLASTKQGAHMPLDEPHSLGSGRLLVPSFCRNLFVLGPPLAQPCPGGPLLRLASFRLPVCSAQDSFSGAVEHICTSRMWYWLEYKYVHVGSAVWPSKAGGFCQASQAAGLPCDAAAADHHAGSSASIRD